ncbi:MULTISPECIES: hypothetical protein [unclassified Cryobacterium]|uniref:hypothetical protein n=1 Tax=unclassified Cryobacterium TaxID=2649013 RepID=UPI00158096B2|nr:MULTISPECIES: hypothetical protein [unclassified Cryobacterium]
MRTVTRALLTLSALVLLGGPALAGCAPTPTPKPSATATTDAPVFASDADALAAATEAYAAYDSMTAEIAATGGTNPERIEPFVTVDYYPALENGFQKFHESGQVSQGNASFDTVSLVGHETLGPGMARVEVYLCSDVTNVRLHDISGADVTPAVRPNRIPLQIVLLSRASNPSALLISEEKVWSGRDFCLQ